MANMTLIEAKTVGAGGIASITFNAIPQTYTDLKILISARSDEAGGTAQSTGLSMSINGVTTNRTAKTAQGYNTSVVESVSLTNGVIGTIPGAAVTSLTFNNVEVYFTNYASSSNNKSFSIDSVTENNSASNFEVRYVAGLWSQTAAITTIGFVSNAGNLVEGSTFYLYGISSAAISPTPYATGGTIYQDDTYFYHMFTSTGVLTPSQALSNVNYLVVAGGGGGGYGGGGGAGGLRCTVGATGGGGTLPSAISLASGQAYAITVGAGGTGTTSYSNGVQGSASSFIGGAISISTVGGGGGGGTTPTTGGSGGGYGNNTTGTGANGTSNEGFAGGNGDAPRGGGGGGGAGFIGQGGYGLATPTGWGGNGGDGILTTIGGNATYYGGGGGGAHNGTQNVNQGQGGLGGGGLGGTSTAGPVGGLPGTANTGGGGGACNMNANIAGNGGSGIVIVRYAK